MFKVAGIDHIVLRTSKLADMLSFYTDVLGCQIERKTTPEIGLTQLRAGNALIDLVDADSQLGKLGGGNPTPGNNNLDHFCLQLSPISEQDIRAHLASHQIVLTDFAKRYGAEGYGSSIYIEDPQGNVVELRSQC